MLNIITRLLSDEIRKYYKENDPVIFFWSSTIIRFSIEILIIDWKKSIREIGIQIDY